MDTTTALVYDAVHIFALALHELNMIQNINIGPIDCSGMISGSQDPTINSRTSNPNFHEELEQVLQVFCYCFSVKNNQIWLKDSRKFLICYF